MIICSTPRSGSWLLAGLLESTGACGHPREYFRPDYEAIYARQWGLRSPWSFPTFVAAVRRAGSTDNGVLAIKLHWGQCEHLVRNLRATASHSDEDEVDLVARHFPHPTFLLLHRADKAAQAVSWFRAIRGDCWWDVGEGCDDTRGAPPTPNLAEIGRLEQTLRAQERRWDEALAACDYPTVALEYADLSADYAATARKVIDVLGLSCDPPTRPERLRKQADELSASWLCEYRNWREATSCEPPS